MDVRNLQKIMKQMSTEELDATRVEIFLSGGRRLAIENPSVVRMQVMGQTTFQVSGEASEVLGASSGADDIKVVMDAAGCPADAASKALEESGGDIAAAILRLKSGTV